MKLKSQMEKQRAYAMRKRNEAKKIGDEKQEWYWLGIIHSMDWAPGSRAEWKYIDGEVMPEEEKFDW